MTKEELKEMLLSQEAELATVKEPRVMVIYAAPKMGNNHIF